MTAASDRRRFRFTLRTLFVVVTMFACWLGWQGHIVRARKDVIAYLNRKGTGVITTREWVRGTGEQVQWNPFWRRWMGDESMFLLGVPYGSKEFTPDRVNALFPEAQVHDLGYSAYDEPE